MNFFEGGFTMIENLIFVDFSFDETGTMVVAFPDENGSYEFYVEEI
jgi:hypothetical protein